MPPIMLRKKYGYTISATKGSNKIIACSKADWSPVKTGSFIVVGNDDHFYKIVDKNQFSFSKEVFVLPSSDQLKVNGTDVNLSINVWGMVFSLISSSRSNISLKKNNNLKKLYENKWWFKSIL